MKKKRSLCTGLAAAFLLALAVASCASAPKVDLTGVTSYYVKDSGSDENSGVSEDAPFKTLAKAITQAAATPVKTITVIGTLTSACEEIKKLKSSEEILITGKTDEAMVKPEEGQGLVVTCPLTIRLERITFTGSGRINAQNGATITLGKGAKITGITVGYNFGGGVYISGGTLVMEEDAEISGNKGGFGGGVYLENAQLTMKGNAVIKDNETFTLTAGGQVGGGVGGGIHMEDASLVIQDNASISGNKAFREAKAGKYAGGKGGGIDASNSTITLQGNATIMNNTVGYAGGGIYLVGGSLVMKNKSTIQGNTADGSLKSNLLGTDIVRPNREEGDPGDGGGVLVAGRTTLTMEDESSITGNSANENGGGVFIAGATFTQNTGTVSGNTAGKNGADIYQQK